MLLCWLLQLPLLTILCFSVRKHDFSKNSTSRRRCTISIKLEVFIGTDHILNMHRQQHGILIGLLLVTLINLTKYNVVQHDLSKETTGGPRQFQNLSLS